jgi:hypothetical protein
VKSKLAAAAAVCGFEVKSMSSGSLKKNKQQKQVKLECNGRLKIKFLMEKESRRVIKGSACPLLRAATGLHGDGLTFNFELKDGECKWISCAYAALYALYKKSMPSGEEDRSLPSMMAAAEEAPVPSRRFQSLILEDVL